MSLYSNVLQTNSFQFKAKYASWWRLRKRTSIRQWINSNGNSRTGLEGKSFRPAQSVNGKAESSDDASTRCAGSPKHQHQGSNFVIPPRSSNSLCSSKAACPSKGASQPSSALWWKEATGCGCQRRRSPAAARGQRRGRGSVPGCSHLRHPQHLALAHGESAKLNKLWLWGFKSSYECYRALLFLSLDKKLLDWTPKKAGTDSWN